MPYREQQVSTDVFRCSKQAIKSARTRRSRKAELDVDWEFSDSRACRGKNRVADRRRDRGQRPLAKAARRVIAFDEVHVNLGDVR